MSQEFLSPDEVDTLLKGADAEPAPAQARSGTVHPCDAAREDRIARERLPALEAINERFVQLLRPAILQFTRRKPELAAGGLQLVRYREFQSGLTGTASVNVLSLKPLRGSALLVFDRNLVFALIDCLFGGSGRVHAGADDREFTPTEQRILQRLQSIVIDALKGAWRPVHPLEPDLLRSESGTRFASIAEPGDIVAATTYPLSFGTGGGNLHFCIPYTALEPIRERLARPLPGDRAAPDQRWARRLSAQVEHAEVELSANLARIPLRVSQLLGMKVGDVLGFDPPEAVTAQVDGVPIFECRYGVLNRQYAIKVERILAADSREEGGAQRAA